MLIQSVSFLSLLEHTTWVARVVLAILALVSIWSWGIILSKGLLLRKAAAETDAFWEIFRRGHRLSDIGRESAGLRFTPLTPVLNTAIDLLEPRSGRSQGSVAVRAASTATIARAMQRSAAAQLTQLEHRLIFLATTAAVAPFVGLFGTVWGVLVSFMGLANTTAATLASVAPGIADALIATAFGLFAAIPALVAYNQFVYRIRNLGGQLDSLQAEILAMEEKDGL